ncbi:FAD dependent oxidoreductase [Penicillium alfredii]|uniref:FAD dependent oxidoreductase n=1 Tax=Penicillium alfredii TaxID=1506179 RepID=A0A9W9K7I7_9EURO|nr:FAD dependent oxidoreductase [Penicillium alfredii]KAJ5096014.1 FAD dependent oxidoreductase [Penicillium alfredii]
MFASDHNVEATEDITSKMAMTNLHPRFAQHTAAALPTETDVVIIGSGITGASIARTFLKIQTQSSSSHPRVVMLEVRSICSGATGRNGGHILETSDKYAELADVFGVDITRKTMRFRLSHLKEMLGVAEEWGLTSETQARKVRFLSVYFGEEPWKAALERLARFQVGMPDESAEWTAYDGEEIPKEFNLPYARGVIAGPEDALWPYKFVIGILARLLADFPVDFRVEEQTPVIVNLSLHGMSFTTPTHTLGTWSQDSEAAVRLTDVSTDTRRRLPCQAAKHSWLFSYDRGFDFLTQLLEGQMMLGGGFAQTEGGGIADLGVSTDSELSLYIDIHLSGALSAIFELPGSLGAGYRVIQCKRCGPATWRLALTGFHE